MFTRPPICKVGTLNIPRAALRHRHLTEVALILKVFSLKERSPTEPGVIGTLNNLGSPQCQLYGWRKDVPEHVDNTGWIYFTLLRGRSAVTACDTHVFLQPGEVARLNDYCPHATYDTRAGVALFWGPVERPCDQAALIALETGVAMLAAGRPNAPRVSPGYQVPFDDECYAWKPSWDKPRLMLRSEQRKSGAMLISCSRCRRRAARIDSHFPFHWEQNACVNHARVA